MTLNVNNLDLLCKVTILKHPLFPYSNFFLSACVCVCRDCFASSNFGITLIVSSKEKVVTASQALAAGPQPRPRMETIIVTLMYLAFHSEKIEVQVHMLLLFSQAYKYIILQYQRRMVVF